MRHKFFMDGDTLMVEMRPDASTVVTRPATEEEGADYEAAQKPKRPKKEKVEE